MRAAILGDLHGNLDAFRAVLDDLEGFSPDEVCCVGDLVGYGAEPAETVALVRERGIACVAGNHDHAIVGILDIEYFNPFAQASVFWTRQQLDDDAMEYLRTLPYLLEREPYMVGHGSIHEPEQFHYIQSLEEARRSMIEMTRPVAFVGHSHIPVSFFDGPEITYSQDGHAPIDPESRTLINVGAVGQPRDDDPRASYALYDVDKREVAIRRVAYDIDSAARKILKAGLPEILAERLRFGR